MIRRNRFKWLFGVVGAAFIVLTLVRSFRTHALVLPAASTVLVAGMLIAIGLLAAALSWSSLFEAYDGVRRQLRAAFLASQVGKYVPGGGLVQAVGQVGLSASSGPSKPQLSASFLIHGAVQIAAAAIVSGVLLFMPAGSEWTRLAGLSVILAAGVRREWLVWSLEKLTRLSARLGHVTVPSQSALLRSLAWCLGPILATSIAFWAMLTAFTSGAPLAVVPQFAFAWLVGYVAVPFPAGLGIREAILIGMTGQTGGVVVAASIVHRFVVLAVEGLLAAVVWRSV